MEAINQTIIYTFSVAVKELIKDNFLEPMIDDIAAGLRGKEPLGVLFFGIPGTGNDTIISG